MADEQNRSKNRWANSLVDAIDESALLTELERIGARTGRATERTKSLELKIREEGKLLNQLIAEGKKYPAAQESPFYIERKEELTGSIQKIRARMNSIEESKISRAESEAATFVTKQWDVASLKTQAAEHQRSPEIQNLAFSVGQQSYGELQRKKEDIIAHIRRDEREASEETKGMFAKGGMVIPEKSAAIGATMWQTQERVKELATIDAAMKYKKLLGQDPESRQRSILDAGQEAQKRLSAGQIANEVQTGIVDITKGGQVKQIAVADVNNEIINQSKRLVEALKALTEGTEQSGEKLEELRNAAEESAQNIDKLKTAQGMGAGGGGRFLGMSENFLKKTAGVMGLVGLGGDVFKEIAVNQELQRVKNAAGFANIENQKYDMYRSARGGDIASQMALPAWADAEKFGKTIKDRSAWGDAASTLGWGLGKIAGGGYAAAQSGGLLAAAGAGTIASGLGDLATGATALYKGTNTAQSYQAGVASHMQTQQAINTISASQWQGFRDLSVGMGVAAQGMGSTAGTEFLNITVYEDLSDKRKMESRQGIPLSKTFMEKMTDARMSPEQFSKLSQVGMQQMGSMFNEEQIFAARGLERSGFGSMQENMQRMSMLSQAGSNNPQAGIASVLEAAVSKGLDSSKAINLVAEHTAAMVQTSMGRAAGLDTTAATAQILAAGVNEQDPNKEFAINRAATARDVMRGIGTDVGVNFAAMSATARLQTTTGVSGIEAISLQRVSDEELRSLQDKSSEEIQKFLFSKGIRTPGNMKPEDLLNKTIDARLTTNLQAGSAGLATGINAGEMLPLIKSGKKFEELTEKQQFQLNQAASFAGFATGQELYQQAGALAVPKPAQNTQSDVKKAMLGEGGSDTLKALDNMRTSGFKQMAEAATLATEKMGSAAAALRVLSTAVSEIEKSGMDKEEKASTAALKSATAFDSSIKRFGDHIDAFGKAIGNMKSNPTPPSPPPQDSMGRRK